MWGLRRPQRLDDKPPPLPGPSPAARAALAAASSSSQAPPPLPGPSPAAIQQQRAAEALRRPDASVCRSAAQAQAQIVVTSEESGVKVGVLKLHQQHPQMPEFCCKCGLRDTSGRFEDGVMYCGKCWSLLEDMAALRVSAGLHELQRRDVHTWEDRCEDCGERDPNGAVDGSDGNFYCSMCWHAESGADDPANKSVASHHPCGGGSVMSVCHECGQVGLGEVDETDSNFYCNECWAAIGLARTAPEMESTTPDTAVTGACDSGWQGVLLPSRDQIPTAAKSKASEAILSEAPSADKNREEKPPPLPGPSPAARAAAVYGGLAPLNIQPSLLNEHYVAGPTCHAPAIEAENAMDVSKSTRPARMPVRQHLKERAERDTRAVEGMSTLQDGGLERRGSRQNAAGFQRGEDAISREGKDMKEEEVIGHDASVKTEICKRGDKVTHMSERERERAKAKERQKEERERKREWKEWEKQRRREEERKQKEQRQKEEEQRRLEMEEYKKELERERQRELEDKRDGGNRRGNGEHQAHVDPEPQRGRTQQPRGPCSAVVMDTSAAALERLAKKDASNGKGDRCDIEVIGSAPGGIKVGIITLKPDVGNAHAEGDTGEHTVKAGGQRDGAGDESQDTDAGASSPTAAHVASDALAAGHLQGDSCTGLESSGGKLPPPETLRSDMTVVADGDGSEVSRTGGEARKDAKGKLKGLGSFKAPIKGLIGVFKGARCGVAPGSSAPEEALKPPSPPVKCSAKEKRAAQDGGKDDNVDGAWKDDALQQHRAKRRQRGAEPCHDGAADQPPSPGEKMRMWTEEILPAFDSHLRKKWVHSLWRSGIPQTLRRHVWPLAIGNRLQLAPTDFQKTLGSAQSSEQAVKGSELIECDLPRTRIRGVGSRNSLQVGMLLRAVSALRPQQGYVQGMSFLGAFLLEVMPLEEAFVCLGNLLGLRYFPDFLSMQLLIDVFPAANALGPTLNIAKLQADKIEHRFNILNEILALECSALARHLCSISFTPGLVLTDWWLTIFSRHFAPEIVGRIWDCFLLEGEPLLFRAAVAVFKYFEEQLLGQPLEVCLDLIHSAGDLLTEKTLFAAMASVKTSVKAIRQLLDRVPA